MSNKEKILLDSYRALCRLLLDSTDCMQHEADRSIADTVLPCMRAIEKEIGPHLAGLIMDDERINYLLPQAIDAIKCLPPCFDGSFNVVLADKLPITISDAEKIVERLAVMVST